MSIRCANCRTVVSEWAGWCPNCRQPFDEQSTAWPSNAAAGGPLSPALFRETFLRLRDPAAPPLASLGVQVHGASQLPRPSPLFAHMVPLGRAGLGAAIDAWWTARAKAGSVTVRGRLKLGPPSGDASSRLAMAGRLWQSTPLHSVPVVLELWPVYEGYARMTLTPQGHVIASRRYFRVGHSVLDHFATELARATPRTGPTNAS
jgi:hypothetical protein